MSIQLAPHDRLSNRSVRYLLPFCALSLLLSDSVVRLKKTSCFKFVYLWDPAAYYSVLSRAGPGSRDP